MTTDRAGPEGTIERKRKTRRLPSGAVLTVETGPGWHMAILQGPYHEGDIFEMLKRPRNARATCGQPPEAD